MSGGEEGRVGRPNSFLSTSFWRMEAIVESRGQLKSLEGTGEMARSVCP